VPAHDERDNEFARKYDLPIVQVVKEQDAGGDILQNSGDYNGMVSSEAKGKVVADLAVKGLAKEKTNFKMRDWSVSRQRYWGAPIPIIHCDKCGTQLVPDEQLPVVLPELDDFKPAGDGRSALARATDWLKVKCPNCGGDAERETDTLDTYICSSWYMYRYFDPHNQHAIFDTKLVKHWEPIDFYNGADHATAHLLYARFIGHFFKKIGLVDVAEPFKQFLFNGKVTAQNGEMFSKSKGNGVDPLEIIEQGYGADALRTYLMFAAPLDTWARWDPQGVPGTHRFLSRVWALVQDYLAAEEKPVDDSTNAELRRITAGMVKKMTIDIEENRYNTAIAAAMEAVNSLYKLKVDHLAKNEVWLQALEAVVACVAPFAPHISEELWHELGHSSSVHRDSWPNWDESALASDTVTVAVQVNGKVRGEVELAPDASEEDAVAAAKDSARVKAHVGGHEIVKTIYVPGKILNIVVR
jgi:leucyl-tRNA synthetase